MSHPDDRATLPDRRDFLRLAVLAPVAIAGCAGANGASRRPDGDPASSKGGAAAEESGNAVEAIRAVPLSMDVEPAFVFRAGRGE